MSEASPFSGCGAYPLSSTVEVGGVSLRAEFGDVAAEYRAAREAAAVCDRSHRALAVVRGGERRAWLHNFVTNSVASLEEGRGVYAFATDVRGRTQFDVNILALPDALWLDLYRPWVAMALQHLGRYIINEDVQLADASGEWARLGCCGPQSVEVARRIAGADLAAMTPLDHLPADDGAACLVRHDFAGPIGFELFVPRARATWWWERLCADPDVQPVGHRAMEVLRIEAGLPASGREIDSDVLPPETGQIERGICYDKGCYLGQEVIERMRSRGSVAHRLVRLRVHDGSGLRLPVPMQQGGRNVGRITSLEQHPIDGSWVGLGYLRTNVETREGIVAGAPPRRIAVL